MLGFESALLRYLSIVVGVGSVLDILRLVVCTVHPPSKMIPDLRVNYLLTLTPQKVAITSIRVKRTQVSSYFFAALNNLLSFLQRRKRSQKLSYTTNRPSPSGFAHTLLLHTTTCSRARSTRSLLNLVLSPGCDPGRFHFQMRRLGALGRGKST